MSNYKFVFDNLTGHLNFIDPDCYYQLRRLVYFIANFPHSLNFDPLADWPNGAYVDWPNGFIYLVGIPLKLFGVNSFRGVELGACLILILYGLLTCAVIFALARKLIADASIALLVFFLASMNFLLIRFSCLGQIDHHIFEAMFPPLIVLLSLKAFEELNSKASIALGFVLSLALMTTSSSIFVIGVFFALYSFVLGKKENSKNFLVVSCIVLFALTIAAIANYKERGLIQMIDHPSFFHVSLVFVLAMISFLAATYRQRSAPIILGSLVLLIVGYALQFPKVLMDPLAGGFRYVFGREGVLQSVSEAAPLFRSFDGYNFDFMHLNFGYFVYLLPIVWVLLFFQKRFSVAERCLFISLSMLSLPGIFQKRFSQIMIGLFLVFVGWCLYQTLQIFRRWEFRIGPLVTFALFCLAIFPTLQFGFAPSGSSRDVVDFNSAKFLLSNLKDEDKSDEKVWNRLALKEPVALGIWANPNMGHLLNYLTGYGVVVNSFYHSFTFDLDFKWREIESDADFDAALKENKIGYYLLADDFQFYQLQYRLRNLSPKSFVETMNVHGIPSTVFNLAALKKKAWARRLIDENEVPGSEKLFQVRFKTDHFYNYIKAFHFKNL